LKIAICTQLEYRDRLIDEKIGELLRQKGHTVGIGNFVWYGREFILKAKPDVVVIPEVRCEHTIDFVEAVNDMNIVTVVRRTEPGYSRTDYEKADESHIPTVMGHWPYRVDLEIVWGKEFAEIVKECPLALNKNIKAAGAFTLDYYFPRPEKKSDGKTILFASAWDYATRDPEYCIPEMPVGDPSHIPAQKRCREGKDKWIAEIQRFTKKYPDWRVILKTHPGEDSIEYQNIFGNKVEVIHNEFAFRVLPKADVLIHAGSTMAVEAHLMDIPAFRFCNYIEDSLILDISPEIQEVNLSKVKFGKSNARKSVIKKLEKTFFGKIDGKACQRTAEYIDKLEPRETDIPKTWPPSKRDYTTYGVYKELKFGDGVKDIIQCSCCKKLIFAEPSVKFIKCPHCSIMLTRMSDRKGNEPRVR
jgi:surface carbohydrate biosynthesis protein